MPRVEVAPTQTSRAGVAPPAEVTTDPANNHKWNNTGKEIIIARNNGGTPKNIVFVIPGSVDEQALADRTIQIPAGATRVFGPFPTTTYNQNENSEPSMAYFDVEAASDIKVIIYRLP